MDEITKVKDKLQELMVLVHRLEKKLSNICEHEFIKELPDGLRDNGEFDYRCRKCGYTK